MPLGPGQHHDVSEARGAEQRQPVDPATGQEPGIAGDLRLPVRQDQPAARPEHPARLVGRDRRIGREVERVDGHGRVGAGPSKPGLGEVADHETGPPGQPEQCRAPGGLIHCDRREVHAHQRYIRLPGDPEPGTAASAPQVDEHLAGHEVQRLDHVAEQADRDERVRLNLRRQVGFC